MFCERAKLALSIQGEYIVRGSIERSGLFSETIVERPLLAGKVAREPRHARALRKVHALTVCEYKTPFLLHNKGGL